jgi:hypothetical protein
MMMMMMMTINKTQKKIKRIIARRLLDEYLTELWVRLLKEMSRESKSPS